MFAAFNIFKSTVQAELAFLCRHFYGGNTHTNTYTVWTQRGRRFIIALYENDWNVKKAIKQIKGEMNPAA